MKPSARFPKLLVAGIVIVLLVGVTVTAGVIYVAHRIRPKAADRQSASNIEKSVERPRVDSDSSPSADPSASPSGKPPSPHGRPTDNPAKLTPAPTPSFPLSTPPPPPPLLPLPPPPA